MALLEDADVDAERLRTRLDEAERRLRTPLHHVAELTREDELQIRAAHVRRIVTEGRTSSWQADYRGPASDAAGLLGKVP